MTKYNEEQALVNHTEAWRIIGRLRLVIERLASRIETQQRMVLWLQKRNAELEAEQSPLGQAEKVFK